MYDEEAKVLPYIHEIQINKVLSLNHELQSLEEKPKLAGHVFNEDYLVIKVDALLNSIYLMNVETIPKFPICLDYSAICSEIENGNLEVIDMLWPKDALKPFDELPENKQAKAQTRFDEIEPLLQDLESTLRNKYGDGLFQRVIEESGRSRQYIYDCFLGFLYYGQRKSGLALPIGKNIIHVAKEFREIRVKQGRPNETLAQGKVLDEKDFKAFHDAKRLYLKRNGPSIQTAFWQVICKQYFKSRKLNHRALQSEEKYKVELLPATERPTLDQFKFWLNKEFDGSIPKRDKSRLNPIEQSKDKSGRSGDAHEDTIAYGQVFELDETPFEEELVSVFDESRGTKIGKATVYFIIDRFSKYIAGFYITTESPSYKTVRQLLFNAGRDKHVFLEELGLPAESIQWQYRGLPSALFVDNAEFKNQISEGAVFDLQTQIKFARVGKGDDKPNVEQLFNIFRNWFKGLSKGLQSKSLTDIATQLARKHAALTIHELNLITAIYVNFHNNYREIKEYTFDKSILSADIPPIPAKLCEWCLTYRPGHTVHYSDDELYMKLLAKSEVSVHRKGIYFPRVGLWYNCEWLLHEGYQDRRSSRNSITKMICRYNESFVDFMFIDTDDGLKTAVLDHRSKAFSGLSHYEVLLQKQEMKLASAERKEIELGYRLGVLEFMNEVIKKANLAKTPSPIPKLAKIKDNRAMEELINKVSDINRYLQASKSHLLPPETTLPEDNEPHAIHDSFYAE